jgi:hypothetical protein
VKRGESTEWGDHRVQQREYTTEQIREHIGAKKRDGEGRKKEITGREGGRGRPQSTTSIPVFPPPFPQFAFHFPPVPTCVCVWRRQFENNKIRRGRGGGRRRREEGGEGG